MSLYERVKTFMIHFGQVSHRLREDGFNYASRHIAEPSAPPDDVVRNRCKWQLEETLELLDSCFPALSVGPDHANAVGWLRRAIATETVAVDLVAYADANADIRYVAYGNDIAAGIYSPDIDAEVCRSNDTKSPPGADGKVRKGDGYSPPDIAGVLKEQGWKT